MRRNSVAGTIVAALAALVVAAGGAAGGRAPVRVALVTGSGVTGSRGFDALAEAGLAAAKKRLGVQGRVFVSASSAEYASNLATAARLRYDLVLGTSPAMAGAIAGTAARFPETRFAIVDASWSTLPGRPQNARGLVFAVQESGYLAGAAAALASTTHTVGSIGSRTSPGEAAFLAGYRAGARNTVAGTVVRSAPSPGYRNGCEQIALRQIAAGSDAVTAATPPCAAGALEAAGHEGAWGIGVDTDQSFRGHHVLTSALKNVDAAVYGTIADVVAGRFRGGGDTLYDVENGGVGFGRVSPDAPPTLLARLTSIEAAIAAGRVKPPRK